MFNPRFVGGLGLVLFLAISAYAQMDEPFYQEGAAQPGPVNQSNAEPVRSVVNHQPAATIRQFEMVPEKGVEMAGRPVTSDIEMEFFGYESGTGFGDFSGNAIYLRAAYDWANASGRIETQVGLTEMILNIKDDFTDYDIAFNHILSGKASYSLIQKEMQNLRVGASSDVIILSSVYEEQIVFDLSSRFATNWGLNASIEQFIGANQKIVGGVMLQQSFMNRGMSTDLSFSGLWGMAILPNLAMNIDVSYRRTMLALQKEREWQDVVVEDSLGAPYTTQEQRWSDLKKLDFAENNIEPHALTIGATGTYYLTDRLGINAGLRKMFLVKDFSSTTLLVGGRAAF